MKARSSFAARHDRGVFRRSMAGSARDGWLSASKSGLSSWFRLLELAAGQAGLELMNRWFPGAWKCPPIPVVDCTRYPATEHPRPWGRAVRI
jgi:hypothetical protein